MATQRTRKRESIDRLVGVSETVALPEIKAFQKLRVGAITRIIRGSTIPTVTNMESFDVPGGDGQAAICTFETGEEYLLSLKKIVACPEGLDGVVYRTKAGTWVWASHKSLASFSASSGDDDSEQYKSGIADAFQNCLRYRSEVSDTPERPGSPGLRAPQLGALHSIVGYWTLESDPCTVVMPTGTGKTEVMLATTVNVAKNGAVLVVVPTAALREQTMGKLTNWGLLRRLGIIPEETPNPIVGIIEHRPRNTEDLDIFERCHVVVATMTSLTQGTAEPLLPEIAARVSTLVIDEAHHIGARTWTQFREAFFGKRILQLTATPFRRDGKLVDGKVIFSYSLARAQQDGHFKPIEFKPVFDFDAARGDEAIASEAVTQLADDLTGGYEHLIMARCDTVARAKEVVKIYERLAPQYHPVLIHSGMNAEGRKNLDALKSFDSRIAVCVNMLGEGFDLPNLKIAAVHDPHKSLAVLLQFAGRFTRSSGHALGKATVIANIADQDMSESLDRLYQEDADWNSLLSEFSSTAAKQHRELVQFLNESARLHGRSQESVEISNTLLHPKCSAAVYRCSKFDHESFFKSLSKRASVQACWYHSQSRTLYFVTRRELKVDWTRSKELHDVSWDLFILHYQEQNGLLYVASSDKSSLHENLAKQVGGEVSLIRGDKVFRAFSEISRLRFNQIGVKKAGRRNLSYAMYTGSDVQQALTVSQRSNAYKSNLAGSRFRNGEPANVGCSYKGRVWSMDRGSVRTFIDWCETVGDKLLDESIDTEALIKNVLVLEELHQLPDSASVLSVDWPAELRRSSFERSVLKYGEHRDDLSFVTIEHLATNQKANEIHFRIRAPSWSAEYSLMLGVDEGFSVSCRSKSDCRIKTGGLDEMLLSDYFCNYPPLMLLADLSEIDGNLWIRPSKESSYEISNDRFEAWDWTGVDITQESRWKDGKFRSASIQNRVASELVTLGADVVFDDDAAGEAADLVAFRELPDAIELSLYHCKFSGSDSPGERVKDIVEVCSQAIRSSKWKWSYGELCKHLLRRESKLSKGGRTSRFVKGNAHDINRFNRLHRGKEVRTRIVVVQPGLKEDCTEDQRFVLAATDSYLLETIGTKLEIICSP